MPSLKARLRSAVRPAALSRFSRVNELKGDATGLFDLETIEAPPAEDLLPADDAELAQCLENTDGFSTRALSAYRRGLIEQGMEARFAPIRLVEFTRAFFIGGTETQLVELLAGLEGGGFDLSVG